MADFETAFPDADIYLAFTSYTCVNRVFAETGIERYQPDLWLKAIGKAGYKKVAVQSLHIIPGEEYLNLMNKTVMKDFMIEQYPNVQVTKGTCLVYDEDDVQAVSAALYDHYKSNLADKKHLLLLMGHGNPDKNYNANSKYAEVEEPCKHCLLTKTYSSGLSTMATCCSGRWTRMKNFTCANAESVYSKLTKYCEDNNLQPSDITISLAPFMSIAGDHAHNDLWGIEDGDDFSEATPGAELAGD